MTMTCAIAVITAMMEMTALDAKPLNNSVGGTRPSRPTNTMTAIAAMSTRTSSETNKPMVAMRTTMTSMAATAATVNNGAATINDTDAAGDSTISVALATGATGFTLVAMGFLLTVIFVSIAMLAAVCAGIGYAPQLYVNHWQRGSMVGAQAEKVLKKHKISLPDGLVVSVSSGDTIAPESDPRPAVLNIGMQLSAALSKLH